MVILNRSELLARLRENIVLVSFNKVNGELRNMRCTLIPAHIPNSDVENYVSSNKNLPENSGRFNVWDVDAQGWRSFMIERINYTMCPAPAVMPSVAKTVLTPAPVRQQKSYPSAIEAALRD